AGQLVPAILAGETQVAFLSLASTLPHIRAGRMKALATAMPSRLAELPEVPTLAELGFSGIGTNAWQGMFAPAATPKPVLDKLYGSIAGNRARPVINGTPAKQMP